MYQVLVGYRWSKVVLAMIYRPPGLPLSGPGDIMIQDTTACLHGSQPGQHQGAQGTLPRWGGPGSMCAWPPIWDHAQGIGVSGCMVRKARTRTRSPTARDAVAPITICLQSPTTTQTPVNSSWMYRALAMGHERTPAEIGNMPHANLRGRGFNKSAL